MIACAWRTGSAVAVTVSSCGRTPLWPVEEVYVTAQMIVTDPL